MRRCLSEKEWGADADCSDPAGGLRSAPSGMGVILRLLVRPSGIRVLPDGVHGRFTIVGFQMRLLRCPPMTVFSCLSARQARNRLHSEACSTGQPMVRLRDERGVSAFWATIVMESDCQLMSRTGGGRHPAVRSDHVEHIDATDRYPSILGTAAAVAGHHLLRHPLRWGGAGPAGRAGHHVAGLPVRRGTRQAAHRCHPDHHCGGHDLGHAGSHRGAEPDRAAGREAAAPPS